jgi:hypothetical protein
MMAGVPLNVGTSECIENLPRRGRKSPPTPPQTKDQLKRLGRYSVLQDHLQAMFKEHRFAVAHAHILPQVLADLKAADLSNGEHITMGQVSPSAPASLVAPLTKQLYVFFVTSPQRGSVRGAYSWDKDNEAFPEDKKIVTAIENLAAEYLLSGMPVAYTYCACACLCVLCGMCVQHLSLIFWYAAVVPLAGVGIVHTEFEGGSAIFSEKDTPMERQWTHMDCEQDKGLLAVIIALAACYFEYGPAEDRKVLWMERGDILGECVGLHVANLWNRGTYANRYIYAPTHTCAHACTHPHSVRRTAGAQRRGLPEAWATRQRVLEVASLHCMERRTQLGLYYPLPGKC